MTDPAKPPLTLEDLYPDLGAPSGQMVPGWPRIVPAGEDLSTIKYDQTAGVRDRRTPDNLKPVEKILAFQLDIDPNRLRLVRAHISDFGAVTMWEQLDEAGAVACYRIAAYWAGTDRLKLGYAKELSVAEGRLANQRAELADLEALEYGG